MHTTTPDYVHVVHLLPAGFHSSLNGIDDGWGSDCRHIVLARHEFSRI
jgi:hypothetical protein